MHTLSSPTTLIPQVCISNYIVTTRNCIMDKRAHIYRERERETHTRTPCTDRIEAVIEPE